MANSCLNLNFDLPFASKVASVQSIEQALYFANIDLSFCGQPLGHLLFPAPSLGLRMILNAIFPLV